MKWKTLRELASEWEEELPPDLDPDMKLGFIDEDEIASQKFREVLVDNNPNR